MCSPCDPVVDLLFSCDLVMTVLCPILVFVCGIKPCELEREFSRGELPPIKRRKPSRVKPSQYCCTQSCRTSPKSSGTQQERICWMRWRRKLLEWLKPRHTGRARCRCRQHGDWLINKSGGVIVRRYRLQWLVKMVGRKDVQSDSMAERHQQMDLMRQTELIDRTKFTIPICQKQMTLLCQTVQSLGRQMQEVQNLGEQMQDGFATESCRRQEDYIKMEEAMTTKMEEGFRNEQQAREQARKEIMVQIDLQAKIRSDISSRAAAATALLVVKSVRLLEEGQVVRSQDRHC